LATEVITVGGERVMTHRELLRPNLKVAIVGRLGRRLWYRLQTYGVTDSLPKGAEDEAAFAECIGLADIVRRPTPRTLDLSLKEKREGRVKLLHRLRSQAPGQPLITFVFAEAAKVAAALLEAAGYCTLRLPGPYVAKAIERKLMADFDLRLRERVDRQASGRGYES
jgi:hypothetical protein